MLTQNLFVHHVYFWLEQADSATEKAALLEGLKKLSKVPTIKQFHIGTAATTNREVIDTTYALSWLAIFDNAADQDAYQVDPIHLEFVATCKHLWKKVVVYDSLGAY
jgi:hypothetical protein